jgi:undecaprenyl-phosphate galactose phosphotransferase
MSVVAAALSTVLDCPVPTRLTFSSAPRKKSVARHVGRFVHAATLAFADVAAIAVAFGLAFALARSFSPALTHVDFVSFHKAFFDRAPVALPILAAALLWNQSRGHYTERHPFWSEARDFLSLAALGIVAEGFIQFAVKEHISRTWIAASWTLFIPVCLAFRAWMKWALIEVGVRQIRVALFGSNLASVREAVESERLLGLHVVEEISGADPRTAAVLARKARAEFAVVAMGGEADGLAISIANHLSHEGIPFALCPPLGGIGLSSMRPVVLFGHDSVLLVERNGLAAPLAQAIKRAVDVVASILGLAVVSPVIAAAALAVKRDGGPAFYSQIRIGSNGRPIRIWKLRSMATDSDERLEHLLKAKPELRESWERDRKLKDDPRITWIGGFLRKSAIDELPQLLNVLIGDMSLVGPRPILRDEVTRYGDSARFYLGVRPGMTGLWQVSGRNDISYERRIELDAWYVRNWSLWVDTVVVLKTIPALICRCGAY